MSVRTAVSTPLAPAIVWRMQAASPTTTVEIDASLLGELRARRPGKDDRSLLEELARVELGMAALTDSQERNALSEDEANELAVRAVREVRAERRDR